RGDGDGAARARGDVAQDDAAGRQDRGRAGAARGGEGLDPDRAGGRVRRGDRRAGPHLDDLAVAEVEVALQVHRAAEARAADGRAGVEEEVVVGEEGDAAAAGGDRAVDEQVVAAGVGRLHEDVAGPGGRGAEEGEIDLPVGEEQAAAARRRGERRGGRVAGDGQGLRGQAEGAGRPGGREGKDLGVE